MTLQIIYILTAILLSAVCGFIAIPLIMDFCQKKGLYDQPNSRKIHKNAIPRLGGISFLPSMLLASVIMIIFYNDQFIEDQVMISLWSVGFFISLLIIYTTGLIDDLIGLGAKTKFSAQAIAACILPLFRLYINNLYGFFGIYEIPFWIGAPLTVFIIIFVCNAINLIDGIDGLSGSLSLYSLTGFLICFFREGMVPYCLLIAGLMGVLIPFLYFNIFGNAEKKRKIFMGDSGSLTLGFILGFLFVKFTMENPNVKHFSLDSMVLAYTLLIVPVFDVVRVSLVRIRHHKPIFNADKNHIHHKLMRTGLNQHQALICILALALFYSLLNYVLNEYFFLSTIVLVDIAVWIIFHQVVNCCIRAKGEPVFLAPPTTY